MRSCHVSLTIDNARVLLPGGSIEDTTITIEDGVVTGVGENGRGRRLDAGGRLVLPGAVDLHGDGFERQLMPRPGVHFAHDIALIDTDRQLLASGITTVFHSLTWSWEPGLRGREAALTFRQALEAVRPSLICDTRLHVRFETANLDVVGELEEWLDQGAVDLLAFNDHLDLMSRKLDSYDKMSGYLNRTGLTREEFIVLLEEMKGRRGVIPRMVERLAARAAARGIPMASHDDPDPETRRWFHELGCRLSEFPVDPETAEEARRMGDAIILGAPNALRGKSHDKRLTAREALVAGLCTVLTSDYYYPTLLHAPFVLARTLELGFGRCWDLVSGGPARAVGMEDRGAIAPGKRADIIIVDDAGTPTVTDVIVEGRHVFAVGRSACAAA
ncbi:alpha-D-ribose 1-methylphosphonate 5-triphosphate diphosphatase [Oceanidesulfovibrio marinus]|uniref:Alpha-D-ribose 1-methylphosphonate 5-triphosphate diphosphatase n=1 Tax=Oceanidesulfovibrio marinus TaxID=370038 RepID=A0ABX6NI67_9BACT|nr:alpha-D-ribose 1-methylphosphonate 5-triphosphate diphosphatase [Oceanidesulfovibrio marinus]